MDVLENTPEWLSIKESILEENIIQLLWQLSIDASVKTNKKSLPYKEIFETTFSRTKPYSNSFHYKTIYREFIYYMLNKEYKKIRFYCELQPIPQLQDHPFSLIDKPDYKCSIKYYTHY